MVPECLKRLGFESIHRRRAKRAPDGIFQRYIPKPEERSALDIALRQAKAIDADLVMATDPIPTA